MKEILTKLKSLSPARILTWLERGAEAVHNIPYRIAAWLIQVPARIKRAVPVACRRIRQGAARLWAWMAKKDITPRLTAFVPLCLAALLVSFCLQVATRKDITYLITEGAEPEFIYGQVLSDREFSGLQLVSGKEKGDAQLILQKGQWITVRVKGHVETVKTRQETVAHLLRRLRIPVGEDQMVVLNVSGNTPAISVQNTYSYTREQTVPLSYETQYAAAPLLDKGTEELMQSGENGNILETYRDTYRNGELESTQLMSAVTTEAIPEIIGQGTKVQEVSRDDRIKEVFYNDDGSGYLLFESGETMTFSEKVICNATAYSIGSWTASGLPTKVGHIAVDTSVFPYHTRFYIYTNDGYLVYGNAVAADCGSAIKGYKIDLWFETFDEACWFGRRDCTVFVLD